MAASVYICGYCNKEVPPKQISDREIVLGQCDCSLARASRAVRYSRPPDDQVCLSRGAANKLEPFTERVLPVWLILFWVLAFIASFALGVWLNPNIDWIDVTIGR